MEQDDLFSKMVAEDEEKINKKREEAQNIGYTTGTILNQRLNLSGFSNFNGRLGVANSGMTPSIFPNAVKSQNNCSHNPYASMFPSAPINPFGDNRPAGINPSFQFNPGV